MTTPLYICRTCRGLPEDSTIKSADGQRWLIACTRCNRRVTSLVSYEDAKARWNGDGPKPEPYKPAMRKFRYERRAKV